MRKDHRKEPRAQPVSVRRGDRKKYEEAKKKPLKFGYLIEDHEMKCAPSIRNSLLESCEKLRAAGHEVVQF